MPYIKPEQLLALQSAAKMTLDSTEVTEWQDSDSVEDGLRVCPVCGDYGCSKDIVKCNGVYVHPEDAAEADVIDTPWRQ